LAPGGTGQHLLPKEDDGLNLQSKRVTRRTLLAINGTDLLHNNAFFFLILFSVV
jgi:hypothetical protein